MYRFPPNETGVIGPARSECIRSNDRVALIGVAREICRVDLFFKQASQVKSVMGPMLAQMEFLVIKSLFM